MTLRNLSYSTKVRRAVKIVRERIDASPIVKLNVKNQCEKVARQYKLNVNTLERAYYLQYMKKKQPMKTILFTYMFER